MVKFQIDNDKIAENRLKFDYRINTKMDQMFWRFLLDTVPTAHRHTFVTVRKPIPLLIHTDRYVCMYIWASVACRICVLVEVTSKQNSNMHAILEENERQHNPTCQTYSLYRSPFLTDFVYTQVHSRTQRNIDDDDACQVLCICLCLLLTIKWTVSLVFVCLYIEIRYDGKCHLW